MSRAVDASKLAEELLPKLDELSRIVADIRMIVEKYMGGPEPPPDWMIPRIFVWYEIYVKDGIVSRDEFHRIGKKYGYDTRGLGGFFTGDRPSLRYIGVNKDRVMLEDWAAKEVEKYMGWIKANMQYYQK